MYNSIPALVTFGLGGHGVEFMPQGDEGEITSSLSGYNSPENFFLDESHNDPKYENVPVIDQRVPLREHMSLAITMPMVSTKLKDDEVSECPEPSDTMLLGLVELSKLLLL